MDCFPRKSLSKYLTDMIDFNKHDINIFINDKWRKYVGGDSSKLQDDLNFAFDQWRMQSQPSQGARIALQREPCLI
jgi:hypothetical protein